MLERLNQALNHLEACLEGEVDMAEVARIAAVSEYHFRRLFSALAGMPLGFRAGATQTNQPKKAAMATTPAVPE